MVLGFVIYDIDYLYKYYDNDFRIFLDLFVWLNQNIAINA